MADDTGLDERLWRYHDQYHAGTYGDCRACADIWHWEKISPLPRYSGNPNKDTGRKGRV